MQASPRAAGAPVVFETVGGRDDYLVIPSDAEPYLAAGILDRALFNGADLVRDGRDDASTGTLPVIVDYAGKPDRTALATGAATLPGATRYGVLKGPIHLSDFKGKTAVLAFFYKARTKG